MTGLVLDTNVVVSANLNSEGYEALVVSLALSRKVRLFVSRPILEEYERVLLYPRLKFDAREVGRFMAILRKTARLVTPARTITESVDDADNRVSGMCRSGPRGLPGHRQPTALPKTVE